MRRRVVAPAKEPAASAAKTASRGSPKATAPACVPPTTTLAPPKLAPKRVASNTRPPSVTNRVIKKDPVEAIFDDDSNVAVANALSSDIDEISGDDADINCDLNDITTDISEISIDDPDIAAGMRDADIDAANAVDDDARADEQTKKRGAKGGVKPKSTRGPGRPRKSDINGNVQIDGVLAEPADVSDILEMSYHAPSLIKKIFASLGVYGVKDVNLEFENDCMRIRTQCKFGKNTIQYRIEGSCVLAYYCKEPIVATVRLDLINEALSAIGRAHNRIMFIIKEREPDKLHVVSTDQTVGITSRHSVSIVLSKSENITKWDKRTDYPVQFTYPSQEFKRLVTITARTAPNIKFAIEGQGDICIDVPSKHNLSSNHTLDKTKFGVVSTLDEDDIVIATVSSESAKKFADHVIGDSIIISLHAKEAICFESMTDKRGDNYAIVMQVFTSNIS